MPSTYAVLGATGTVGGTVLSHLLTETSHTVNVLVRSKDKLLKQSSTYQDVIDSSRLKVYEGSISDLSNLQSCLADTAAVFLCVAASINQPGTHIAQDQANNVISALKSIRSESPQARMPKLVMLTSAETSAKFSAKYPRIMYHTLYSANSYIYDDLKKAEVTLRSESSWLTSVYFKPGGLAHDKRSGHKLSLDDEQTFISFADCAAGMVEVADETSDIYDGREVTVQCPGGGAGVPFGSILPVLIWGLLYHFIPASYGWVN